MTADVSRSNFPARDDRDQSARLLDFQLLQENGLLDEEIPRFEANSAMEAWREQRGIKPREVKVIEGPPATKTKRFNANSPDQVIKGLRSLGWEPEHINASGSINTGESVLWNSGLPAGRLIAADRGYYKLRTFIEQWINHAADAKLHPHFVSLRAATGRSAAKSPNIQQIPTDKQRP